MGAWKTGTINSADINKDGYLDLVVSVSSHYLRRQESFYILYGGPDGYDPGNIQEYAGGYTPGRITIADYDNDGNLDLLVGAYSTAFTRQLPARIFRGDGNRIDIEHPTDIQANAAYHIMVVDISRNGYLDLVVACHRNDLGHQVDSLILWNGPEGISLERATPLPSLGPHCLNIRDFGNAYTREPMESYVSPPFDMKNQTPSRIHWEADVPETTALKFQLRWSATEEELERAAWHGPGGEATYYQTSGAEVWGVPRQARWLQYRAVFVSLYGCRSPKLWEVRIDLCSPSPWPSGPAAVEGA